MKKYDPSKLKDKELKEFFQRNKKFDLMRHDAWKDQAQNSPINELSASANDRLLRLQRIARVVDDFTTAESLIEQGYDSAHHIALKTEQRFLRDSGAIFSSLEEAKRCYRKARGVKGLIEHFSANLHSSVASPHFSRSPVNNAVKSLTSDAQKIPNYWDIFGSQNFCACDPCASIFGPAAYMVDIMRIIDDYITDNQNNNIPAGYSLRERRPDLFSLPLTCANVNDPIKTIALNNQILTRKLAEESPISKDKHATGGSKDTIVLADSESPDNGAYDGMKIIITAGACVNQIRTIQSYSGSDFTATVDQEWVGEPDSTSVYMIYVDPYLLMATAQYPFMLPYNSKLIEIRSGLEALATPLTDIYDRFAVADVSGSAKSGTINTIVFPTDVGDVIGMILEITDGAAQGNQRLITRYDSESKTATVSPPFSQAIDTTSKFDIYDQLSICRERLSISVDMMDLMTTDLGSDADKVAAQYGYPNGASLVEDLSPVANFIDRVGISREQLDELLTQGLSPTEVKDEVANEFFVNQTGEELPPMAIELQGSGESAYYEIANLSVSRLGRLSRFIRLELSLSWSAQELQDFMSSVGTSDGGSIVTDISLDLIRNLGWYFGFAKSANLNSQEALAFWSEMSTRGQGNGKYRQDMFDKTFNSPTQLHDLDPYTSKEIIPFDPARPLEWEYTSLTGMNATIRSRLRAALSVSDNDLTEIAQFISFYQEQEATDKLCCDLSTLTLFYRVSKQAQIAKVSISDFLSSLWMLYFPSSKTLLMPTPGVLDANVFSSEQLYLITRLISESRFTVPQLSFILFNRVEKDFDKGYRDAQISPMIETLATMSSGILLSTSSFIFQSIDEAGSALLYGELEKRKAVENGVMLDNSKEYTDASKHYPITKEIFNSGETYSSQDVMNALANCHPPILVNTTITDGNVSQGFLSQRFTKNSDIEFLYLGEENAANLKSKSQSTLLTIRDEILFTQWAVLFPITQSSFTSDLISSTQSSETFESLSQEKILIDIPGETTNEEDPKVRALSVDYTSNTSLDFLFTSQGAGQRNGIASYNGSTRTLTCNDDWTTKPDDTSYYLIGIEQLSGTAPKVTKNTVTLSDDASSKSDAYNGMWISINVEGVGPQSAVIAQYDGTTKTATIVGNFKLAKQGKPTSITNINFVIDQKVSQGLAQGSGDGANTIVLSEDASTDNSAYTSAMTLALIPNPNADNMRRQVADGLTECRENIEHTAKIIDQTTIQQTANVISSISDLLQSDSATISALLPFVGDNVDIQNLLPNFLIAEPDGQVNPTVFNLIQGLARADQLIDTLKLDQQTINALVFNSRAFNIDSLSKLTLIDISNLSIFAALQRTSSSKMESLIDYLMMPFGKGLDSDKVAALAIAMNWPLNSLTNLITTFWPDTNDHSNDYTTLAGVFRLDACFAISQRIGMGIESLNSLYALNDLGLVVNGSLDNQAWLKFEESRDAVLAALSATLPEKQFSAAFDKITSSVYESDRNGLAAYTLWVVADTSDGVISTIDELSQFLLIDIKMSGCDLTSPIAQATGSLQVYLQRCRSQFEPGVIDLSGIKPNWWSWMMNYRIWEANRKIFMYPENYVDPTLRQRPSPQFQQLTDDLLQINSEESTVTDAYIKYVDGVSKVSNLAPVDAFYAKAFDPVTNDEEDTLFFLGRTRSEPYRYQVRTYRLTQYGGGWTTWAAVESQINTPLATISYAFNRMYLFWNEIGESESSNIDDNKSTTVGGATASVKCVYQKPDDSWTEPQTVVSDIALTYQENYELQSTLNSLKSAGTSYTKLYNPDYSYIQKPYSLYLDATKESPQTSEAGPMSNGLYPAYPFSKSLFVLAGHGMPCGAETGASIDSDPSSNSPKVLQNVLDQSQSMVKATNTTLVKSGNAGGYMPLNTGYGVNINQNLAPTTPYLSAINLSGSDQVYSYQPLIDRSKTSLEINPSSANSITTNYVSDDYPGLAKGFRLPTAANNSPFEMLTTISPSVAAVATIKNYPLNYLFDNGDQAYWFVPQGTGVTAFPISQNLNAQGQTIDGGRAIEITPLNDGPRSMINLGFSAKRITSNAFNHYLSDLLEGGVEKLLTLPNQALPEPPFKALGPYQGIPQSGYPNEKVSFDGAFGEYMWETFFYGPTLVADILKSNNRFEEALQWYEYLFNPTTDPSEDPSDQRYWRYLPFREMTSETLTQMLTNPEEIWIYNNDPFNPDAIARKRVSAFAKSTVTRYIDNIISWGDNLFSMDTRESIAQATNFYLLAYDLLGPRPEAVAECAVPTPKSFNDIEAEYANRTIISGPVADGSTTTVVVLGGDASSSPDAYTGMYLSIKSISGSKQYITAYDGATKKATLSLPLSQAPTSSDEYTVFVDGIPEFLIRSENSFALVGSDMDSGQYVDAPYNMIDSYFCVPENPDFIAYWDVVEDRLGKIRHCLNIDGVARPLALFAPPIDPAALVSAARSGLSGLNSQLASRTVAPPIYRFSYLSQKAMAFTATVTQFGSALLSALEKKDAESLALLRSTQEKTLLDMTTMSKELAVDVANDELAALQNSLASAEYRKTYYDGLIKDGLNSNEIQNLAYQTASVIFNTTSSLMGGIASASALIPQAGSPFAMTYGGVQVGRSLAYGSAIFKALGDISNFGASMNATMANYVRRESDWEFQKQLADYETTGISSNIAAAEAKVEMAQQDLKIHKQSIKDNASVTRYLESKFTNEQLYKWMSDKLSNLYYQSYTLSLNLALEAQRSYQYEIGVNDTFINFDYWDSSNKGLMAGEALTLSLNQLEKAYMDGNKRPLEIEKTISLKELEPMAFIDLIENGKCVFAFTERLFDDDYPGHYMRMIKSLKVTIPAVLGPYQNFKASLTQASNQVVLRPDVSGVEYLIGSSSDQPDDSVLRSNWMANQKIAVSTGMDDSGQFSINFNDERYLPFEGTGAVSTWAFSLPVDTNQIDRNSISDVIFTLSYTAYDGGELFANQVKSLPGMQRTGGSAFYPLAQQFPSEWNAFMTSAPSDCGTDKCQTMNFDPRPISPPHVTDSIMTGFLVQLQVSDNVSLSAADTPWMTFRYGENPEDRVEFSPDESGLFVFDLERPFDLSAMTENCSLICNVSKAPPSILENGTLNIEALFDISMAIVFEGNKG